MRKQQHEAFGAGHLAATLTSLSSHASSEQISSAIPGATNKFSGYAYATMTTAQSLLFA
jgi:hypothetical protein